MNSPSRPAGYALALLALTLAATARLGAQVTTFAVSSAFANFASGTGNVPTQTSSLFSFTGTTTNNLQSFLLGDSFQITTSAAGAGTAGWAFQGTSSGGTIPINTVLPISYDFTLAKNSGITGDVGWTLKFSDPRVTSGALVLHTETIATGTLSAASASFTGSGNFNFASGVAAGTEYRVELEFTFTAANNTGIVTTTMLNSGFGGQGFTINGSAVPEPSTYAALAGAAMLGFAAWRRRRPAAALTA